MLENAGYFINNGKRNEVIAEGSILIISILQNQNR